MRERVIRLESDGMLELLDGLVPGTGMRVDRSERGVRIGQCTIELQRPVRGVDGPSLHVGGRRSEKVRIVFQRRGESGIGTCELRVEIDRTLEVCCPSFIPEPRCFTSSCPTR